MKEAVVWLHGQERVYFAEDFELKVEAKEFSLSSDYKYQLVCGSCNSPATFVCHKDGRKYFRHPKRTSIQLAEKDKICEKRSNNIHPSHVKKYNEILEQTTLGEITANFQQVFGDMNRWSDKQLDKIIRVSKSKLVIETFTFLEESQGDESSFIKHFQEEFSEEIREAKKFNKLQTEEQYEKLKESLDGSDTSLIIATKLDPSLNLLAELADQCRKWENDPKEYPDEHPRSKYMYPIISKQQRNLFRRLYKMLCHKNSLSMRYFVLYAELLDHMLRDDAAGRTLEGYKHLPENDPQVLKRHLAQYILFSTAGIDFVKAMPKENQKQLDKDIKESKNFILKMSHTGGDYLKQYLAENFAKYTADDYYRGLETAKKKLNNKIKGLRGWIYIATNKSLTKRGIKNEIKIGKTKNKPQRLSQYQFASPDGFFYESHWEVNNRSKAEDYILKALKKYRIINEGGGKEWFKLTIEEAIEKVSKLIKEYEKKYGYFDESFESGRGFK